MNPPIRTIPYAAICLDDEVAQLKAIFDQSTTLTASVEAKKYVEDQGLDPWDYGFNASGKHPQLNCGGYENACEESVTLPQ